MKASNNEPYDIHEQAAPETEAEEDTYSDPEKLDRIAGFARTLSWITLIFFIVKPVIEIYLLWDYSGSSSQNLSSFFLNIFLSGNPSILSEFFLGAVLFVVLQALGEGIYLFMDIEENTRKPSSSSKESEQPS